MFLFDWVNEAGVQKVLSLLYTTINIIRIIVPIGLIIMTTIDIIKKVINPNEKDGQKKIIHRLIAAIVVFFVPLLISFLMKLIGIGQNNENKNTSGNSNNTSKPIIEKINITNCPKETILYQVGDNLILNSNVPFKLSDDLKWGAYINNDSLKLTPLNNKSGVKIDIISYPPGGFAIVYVTKDDKKDTCTINVEKPKETKLGKVYGDINIINCPINNVKVGDKITLKADTLEEVTWYGDVYREYYKLIDNHNGTATIEILKYFSDNISLRVRVDDKNNKTGFCQFYTIK